MKQPVPLREKDDAKRPSARASASQNGSAARTRSLIAKANGSLLEGKDSR